LREIIIIITLMRAAACDPKTLKRGLPLASKALLTDAAVYTQVLTAAGTKIPPADAARVAINTAETLIRNRAN